jgi:hypothetical protein
MVMWSCSFIDEKQHRIYRIRDDYSIGHIQMIMDREKERKDPVYVTERKKKRKPSHIFCTAVL